MEIVNTTLNFVNSMPRRDILAQYHILKITPSQLTTAFAIDPSANTAQDELSIDAQLILDAQLLYKSYFQFLLNIVNNDLINVISGQSPQDVYKIFYTLLEGAQNGTLDTIKCCFQVIRKFINFFGNHQFLKFPIHQKVF